MTSNNHVNILLKNGLIVDGTGSPSFIGNVGIRENKIAFITKNSNNNKSVITADRIIDCTGKLITPGWVDIHTHIDASVNWDPFVSPLSGVGVTTAVFGNCGVGFAPCKPHERTFLMELMEGVEDIPLGALTQGLEWNWETFPQYLDHLSKRSFAIDVGGLIGHGPVRAYVLGKRANLSDKPGGPTRDPITPEEIKAMAKIVGEAVKAGALGFSTSRTLLHRDRSGTLVPGTLSTADELLAIGRAIGENGHGKALFEMASDFSTYDDQPQTPENHARRLARFGSEFRWMKKLSKSYNVPLCFCLGIPSVVPNIAYGYREMLRQVDSANADGCSLKVQVFTRPQGILLCFDARSHPFTECPSFDMLWKDPTIHNPVTGKFDKIRLIRDGELRDRILAEAKALAMASVDKGNFGMTLPQSTDNDGPGNLNATITSKGALVKMYYDNPAFIYKWTETYSPNPQSSALHEAKRRGVEPLRVVYDWLCENEGTAVVQYLFMGFAHHNLDDCEEMLLHKHTVPGLGDSGAHASFLSDPTSPTFLLTHWHRDTKRFPLELAVKLHSKDTAQVFGLNDRGSLEQGLLADINVIDLPHLRIHCPRLVRDLPLGAARWIQEASGYVLTMKSGVITFENGLPTGILPGRLIRRHSNNNNEQKQQPLPADTTLGKITLMLNDLKWAGEQKALEMLVTVLGPERLESLGMWKNEISPLPSAPSKTMGRVVSKL
jgi:N-acyl-D-amino-acid deacylase